MKHTLRLILAVAVATLTMMTGSAPVSAQTSAAEMLEAARARARDIEELKGVLNGADQNMRLATFDVMVGSGDDAMRQIAIDLALASADPLLQAMAFKETVLSFNRIVMSLEIDTSQPQTIQDKAQTILSATGSTYALTISSSDRKTGTFKVTLELRHGRRLRPGMFARVFVETETREDALVVPKAALSLESIGDTVYVAADGKASRREVELGFRQGDLVEIVRGVSAGEQVVVVGQDGLSEGTPLQILSGGSGELARGDTVSPHPVRASAPVQSPQGTPASGSPEPPGGFGKRSRGNRPDFANMTDEQLEQVRARMRSMGMTDEQIEERIKRRREATANGE